MFGLPLIGLVVLVAIGLGARVHSSRVSCGKQAEESHGLCVSACAGKQGQGCVKACEAEKARAMSLCQDRWF